MQNLFCRLLLTIKYCISLCREMNAGCSWGLITSVLLQGCLWVPKGNDWFHDCLTSPLNSMEPVAEIVNLALKSALICLCLSQRKSARQEHPHLKMAGFHRACWDLLLASCRWWHTRASSSGASVCWQALETCHQSKARKDRLHAQLTTQLLGGNLAFSIPSAPERPQGAQKPVTSDWRRIFSHFY